MNTFLMSAEKWLTEMNIRSILGPNYLRVNIPDMEALGGRVEVLIALRESLNTTKIFWGECEGIYVRLEAF